MDPFNRTVTWPRLLPGRHLPNFSSAFPANCTAACRNLQTNRLLTLADDCDEEEGG